MQLLQLRPIFAIAAICALATAQPAKKYKDQQEFELYDAAAKQIAANELSKAIATLESWQTKYPSSDFVIDRQKLLVQSYYGVNQPAKALDAAVTLAGTAFTDTADQIRLQYPLAMAIQRVAEPTPAQVATASAAAKGLAALDQPPPGMAAPDWQRARADLQSTADSALRYIALVPVLAAMKTNDCATAESAARKGVEQFPQSVQATWFLATAQMCLARKDATKWPQTLYSFARAASLDPVSGAVDPKWQQSTVTPYFEKLYAQYHGVDKEAMAQLKQQSLVAPFPDANFTLKSAAQILTDKQADLESKYPEYALWLRVKAALSAPDGDQYFATQLKDSAVPKFTGVLVAAKPECRPKELQISIRGPESSAPTEIVLKLEKALTGKPAMEKEIGFEGVAAAFTQNPFQLTLTTEAAKLSGLQLSPCAGSVRSSR